MRSGDRTVGAQGGTEEAELLLQFLEEDPYFFRSGYAKKVAIQRLKKFNLTSRQCGRVTQLILNRVDSTYHRAEKDYARLALRFCQPDALLPALAERLKAIDPMVGVRARSILGRLSKHWRILGRPEFASVTWATSKTDRGLMKWTRP